MKKTSSRLLDLLRSGEIVSGTELSDRLSVSRAAIWKHVVKLRERGYQIESVHGHGYRLERAPNRPNPDEVYPLLDTVRIGHPLSYLDSTVSTNNALRELAEDGAPEGYTIVAETQSGGRGRMSRAWFSPPGSNLYVSVLLRPRKPPTTAPQIAPLAAVAVCEAIGEFLPELSPGIKWPNDIYLDGRKVAGLLCDMSAEMDCLRYVILGIGINVNCPVSQFPSEFSRRATSLYASLEREISRPALLAAVLNRLEQAYERWRERGLSPFLPAFADLSILGGRPVTVENPGKTVHGIAKGICDDGALLLQHDDGRQERIVAGDVHLTGLFD